MEPRIYKNYYDVVILPPKQVRDYAIGLSKQLYKYNTTWVLGRTSFLPHISLYHIPVKPRNFNAFITELEKIVKDFKAGRLRLDNIKPHYSVLLMTTKPDWLKKLYLRIIKGTLKYFDQDYDIESLWQADKLPQLMQKNIKIYGTPVVGRYFMPHITLGVFKHDKNMIKAVNELRLKKYNFDVKSMFVCELGESHSCQKIVKQIYF